MYTDKNGNNWYKIGLHIHTTLSDGRKSPEEMAKIYKDAGFDAVAITDHWKYHEETEIGGLKIFPGCEYNIGGGDTSGFVMHIVGIGMESNPQLDRETATAQEIIDAVNNCDGMAVLAHPAWSLNTKEQIKPLHGFSMLEIYNSVSDAHESFRPYSGYIVDALANDGYILPLTATDDAHYYDGSDEAKSFIMVKAPDCSLKSIMNAIKSKDFYATQGPELYVKKDGNKITAECSECCTIKFISNAAWAQGRVIRGENLKVAEYTPTDFDTWVRVEAEDKDGNTAWSNIISL